MFLSQWRDFVRQHLRPARRGCGRRRTARPRAEELEGRCVPAAFTFSSGAPDGKIGTASRPADPSNGNVEIESADDFILTSETRIDQVSFTGLVPTGTNLQTGISDVVIEIYRVFPKDSDVARTSGPPTFSVLPKVPTRVNSPSDVAFDTRDHQAFTTSTPTAFTVNQSIVNNIQLGGPSEGAVTGDEVTLTVNLSTPFLLPADHYFFVPQVLLTNGNFLWLSAPKPITGTGTTPFTPDLQSWMRNDPPLAPDWLRIGTDIIGGNPAPTFNASFSLAGETVAPQLTSISPTTLLEGSAGQTVTLNGSNFTSASTVQVNGTSLQTNFVSSSKLTVSLPASLLAEDGALTFVVSDSGATSSGQTLAVTEGVASGSASVTKFALVGKGARATITGDFLDQVNEAHSVRIDWGDGTMTTLNQGIGTFGNFTASHKFKKAPKHKSAVVQVIDDGKSIFQINLSLVAPKKHKKHK
jgi:hypothetical protein